MRGGGAKSVRCRLCPLPAVPSHQRPGGSGAISTLALAPGGRLLVEDVDFPSHFCWPPRAAFDRYVAWYQEAALARGADPAIGHKLPALVLAAGFSQVQARAEQPAALSGPIKAYAPLTLAAISEAVIGGGVEASEIAASLVDLEVARDDDTVFMSPPRVVQCWATRD